MDKVSTLRWDPAVAQARMDNLLSAYYTDKKVDAVLSPYDGLSIGIISSLKGVGYGSRRHEDARSSPARTAKSSRSSRSSRASSPRRSTRTRASSPRSTVGMVDALETGKQPRGQRHQDLRQRQEGRPVLPAEPGPRDQGELEAGPGRRRLLQGQPARPVSRARHARQRSAAPVRPATCVADARRRERSEASRAMRLRDRASSVSLA